LDLAPLGLVSMVAHLVEVVLVTKAVEKRQSYREEVTAKGKEACASM
jgi:hypothetical protein